MNKPDQNKEKIHIISWKRTRLEISPERRDGFLAFLREKTQGQPWIKNIRQNKHYISFWLSDIQGDYHLQNVIREWKDSLGRTTVTVKFNKREIVLCEICNDKGTYYHRRCYAELHRHAWCHCDLGKKLFKDTTDKAIEEAGGLEKVRENLDLMFAITNASPDDNL